MTATDHDMRAMLTEHPYGHMIDHRQRRERVPLIRTTR